MTNRKVLAARLRRKARVRRKLRAVSGSRLRLSLFKSGKNISVQLIDDSAGKTLVAASTFEDSFLKEYTMIPGFENKQNRSNKQAATLLGAIFFQRFKKSDIKEPVYFDRGMHSYCGVVAAFVESAKSSGLVL